ncbi:MAG TPA: deoxyribose-phosphate aldolase [Terriglobales bacterium]|nr:deoxyribose-phosphate aldolase [Terriglobales bacterium]
MSTTAPSHRDWQSVARLIDHTVLKTDARRAHIEQLCSEARKYNFASVCVQPVWVELAVELLKGSGVMTCTVAGFPQGATLSSVKLFETLAAVRQGAAEVDMVINVGALKDRQLSLVEDEIRALADACHNGKAHLKVIIECCLLTEDEKKLACELALKAEANFVKTSTGMSTGGATVEDIRLMRSVVGSKMGVKAAGGIRTAQGALAMIDAGANRIGASASVAIVQELGAV